MAKEKPNVLTMSEDELSSFFGGMTPQQIVKFVKDTKKEIATLAQSGAESAKNHTVSVALPHYYPRRGRDRPGCRMERYRAELARRQ